MYDSLPGWDQDITGATRFDQLPRQAQDYIRRIDQITGRPITIIGIGPRRTQTIVRRT